MNDATDSTPTPITKRAQWFLRWYPAIWRERYGDEFTAHMESELLEHPFVPSRTLNIVLHGVLTRVSLQRALRRSIEATLAAAIATTVVLAVVAAQHVAPALSLTSGYGDGFSAVAMPANPSQVTDLSFIFTSKTRASIRITSVTLEGLRGLATPSIVGVDFERRPSQLGNMAGWPIDPPKGSLVAKKELVPAINRTVTLAHGDTLWLGLRAPKAGVAYVIDGLVVTYVHRGSTHSVVLGQHGFPDVICVVPKGATLDLQPCARQIALATGEAVDANTTLSSSPAIREALAVGSAASNFAMNHHRSATVWDLRAWAARLFPARSTHGVLHVAVVHSPQHLWVFEEKGASKGARVRVCTVAAVYRSNPTEGLAPPLKSPCPATAPS